MSYLQRLIKNLNSMNFQFKINFPFYLAIKLQMNNIKLTIAIATQSPLRVSIAKILNPIKDFI